MHRVLHVITGLNNGGAENTLFRLVTSDTRNQHHVVSLTDGGVYAERLRRAGLRVDSLEMRNGRPTGRALRMLFQLMRETKPSVVQTWMYHSDLIGGLVARFSGRRAIVWGVRATDAHLHDRSLRLAIWVSARLSDVVPARIIIASRTAANVHRALGYKASRIVVVANGYDVNELAPNEDWRTRVRGEWGLSPETKLLGTVARWDPLKDHDNLLAALARVARRTDHPWCCALVGEGMTNANKSLVESLEHHGIARHVLLQGPTHDVAAALNAMDIHILPSKSEGFPNVIAEAMACGTPCVSTDVGDAGLIIGKTGWVVSPGNPDALADAIVAALSELDDKPAWRARTTAARNRIIEHYSISRMVDAYNAVWQEAIDVARPGNRN